MGVIVKPSYPRLNRAHPLSQGMVGAWECYEGAGDRLNDLSGRNNHGDHVNSPAWVPGRSGWALNFTGGSTQYVSIPGSSDWSFGTDRFYIECVFRVPSPSTSQVLVGRWEFTTGDNRRFSLEVTSSAVRFRCSTNGTDAGSRSVTSDTISANRWYHCVAAWTHTGATGNDLVIVLDGQQSGSLVSFSGFPSDSTTGVAIGIMQPDTGATWPLTGDVGFVRIGRHGFTSFGEMSALYHDHFAPYRQPNRAWLFGAVGGTPAGTILPHMMHYCS